MDNINTENNFTKKLITTVSIIMFLSNLTGMLFANEQDYPYGCSKGYTFVEYVDDWKFRCYSDCVCENDDNILIADKKTEDECLQIAANTPEAKGANIGSKNNKCEIILKKCKVFKEDTGKKGPYCSMFKYK